MNRAGARLALTVSLTLGAPALSAAPVPLPRLKPAPVEFVIVDAEPAILAPAQTTSAVGMDTQPLVLQPELLAPATLIADPVRDDGFLQSPERVSPVSQPAVLVLTNDKTALHRLVLRPDVTTALNFQGAERIRSVLMGQAEDFFVDTLKSHQTVSVRPKSASSTSNMTVVTNHDIYHFDLRSVARGSGIDPVYGVVIEDKKKSEGSKPGSLADVAALNFSYTFRGSDDLRPLRLFDDGKHTFFQFPDHIDTPAIFAVGEGGQESIVNQHVRGHYLVVESLARQFTLRRGETYTCIYNKAYPKPHYGSGAPPREEAS